MSINHNPKSSLLITGILIVIGIGGWIGWQRVANHDDIAKLRRYTPHGSHFIDTALTGGSVTWRSREIGLWKVQKKTRKFPSTAEFKAAFQRVSPHPDTTISVHHPALKLTEEEGRQSHDRAEEILKFLADRGYQRAGPIAD
jgi:hypothetical protein